MSNLGKTRVAAIAAANRRYLEGVDILESLTGDPEAQLTDRVAELAPDFARMAIEFPFGDLYARTALDLRSREIAALAALAALGTAAPQLRLHVAAALHLGIAREAIIEILMQTAIYAGFPAALNSLGQCHDLLVDGASCGPCQPAANRVAGQG